MLRPIIGVADNGDFGRIMGSTGLRHMSDNFNDRYFGFVNREYLIGIPVS
jgi:outer membrane scaffolding protein for murein synthesis (MipA/OmpV family)